jgi:NAD(P)-dependent dehydrogenase (short-subunit alcohol dehydrogenase family)
LYALDTITDDDWDDMMATNLTGIKNSIKAELKYIKDGGSIVNAASIAGQRGTPFNAPYGTAKWGVISLTKCAAQEVGHRNVRVNAVAPYVFALSTLFSSLIYISAVEVELIEDIIYRGVIDTPLAAALGDPQAVNERLIQRTALKRIAQPEEVSRVILFLLSDVSGYVTSSVSFAVHLVGFARANGFVLKVINVDGGYQ